MINFKNVQSGISSLKSKVDKLDIAVIVVVKNDVIKKTKYDGFFKNVNGTHTTDTCDLVKKDDYETKIVEIKKKILDHDYGKYITTTQEFNRLMADNFQWYKWYCWYRQKTILMIN